MAEACSMTIRVYGDGRVTKDGVLIGDCLDRVVGITYGGVAQEKREHDGREFWEIELIAEPPPEE